MDKEIVVIVNETGLGNPQADFILSKFKPLAENAKKLIEESNDINVTDVSQVDEMSRARSLRLSLKDIRVEADKTRKALKEDVVKYGNTVQGVYNVIKENIEPIEKKLEEQETFIERIKQAEAAALKKQRANLLSKYVEDISLYNYEALFPEAFDALVASVKDSWEQDQRAMKEKEEERVAKEKAEKEENERIKIEHDRLLKEKKERDETLAKEKEERDAEAKKLKEAADKKLKEEEAKRIALEKEIAAKEAEEKKERDEKAEQERQAALAPEKDKLLAYAESIRTIKSPENLSKAGLELVKKVEQSLLEISQEIKLKVKEL